MNINIRSVYILCALATMLITFSMTGLGDDNHLPGFTARIAFPNGAIRTAEIQGVGCSATICSRVFINAKESSPLPVKIWLDSIAAIKDVREDAALFVMKDGTERRVTLIPDFRVLYIERPGHPAEKLDLGRIRSLEIVSKK